MCTKRMLHALSHTAGWAATLGSLEKRIYKSVGESPLDKMCYVFLEKLRSNLQLIKCKVLTEI